MKKRWTLYRVKPQMFGNPGLLKIARWDGELTQKGSEFIRKHLEAHPENSEYLILIKRELIKEGPVSEEGA